MICPPLVWPMSLPVLGSAADFAPERAVREQALERIKLTKHALRVATRIARGQAPYSGLQPSAGQRAGDIETQTHGAGIFAVVHGLRPQRLLTALKTENRPVMAFDHRFHPVPVAAAKVAHDYNSVRIFTLHTA